MSRPSYDVAAASLPLRPYQQCALSIVQSLISSLCLKMERRIKNDPIRPFTSSSPLRCTDDGVEQAKIGITQSALLYLPTGGGKTRIAAALTLWTRKQGGRTLFIVNRLQLAIQAKEAFLREGIDADDIGVIEKGYQRGFSKPVIIATIQSLSSRRRRRIKEQHQHLVTLSSYKEEGEEEEGEAGLDHAEDDNNDNDDNDRNREDGEDFPLADFVVIDEAHGAVSNSFAPLVDFYLSSKGASRVEWLEDNLGQSRKFNRTFLLGMTATPTRLQGEERLEKVFERLIRGPSVSQLVRDGVLVPPIPIRASHELTQNASKALLQKAMRERQLIVHPFGEDDDIGLSLKRKTADDLSLQTTLEEQKVLNHVVLTWKHYCYQTNDMIIADKNVSQKGPVVSKTALTTETTVKPTTRRSIVFASSVNHSQAIVAAFTAHGVSASHVDGNTSASDRECIYENMRQGNIDVLSSVGVICEGYDEPSVSCVVLLRPTASRGLYVQQVGRGLRSYQGKKDCLVLDFVDNSLRHGPVTVPINCALDSSSTSSSSSLSSTYIGSAEAWVCSDPKCCAISHAAETVCLYCKLPRYGRSSTSSSSSSSSSTSSSSMKNNVSILSAKPIRMQQTKSPYEQGFESISLNASDFFPPPTEANSQEDVDSLVSAISTLALGGGTGGGGGGPGGGKNGLLGIHNTTAQSVIGGNKNSDTVKSDAVRSVGIPIRRPFHSNAEVVRNYTHNNNNTHNNQGLARVPVRPPSSHPPPPPPPPLPPSSLESNTARVGSVVSSVSVSPLNGSNTTSSGTNASGSNMFSQSNTSSTQPQKNLPNNGNGGPSHSATPDIFTNSAFQSACARHSLNQGEHNLLDNFSFIYQDKGWMKQKSGSRWIHTHSGVSDFDASFLLSIAAQITPHVEHEWKNKGAEQSKGLSEKQLGHLTSILKKVQTYHNQHRHHHQQQKSSTLVTSTSTEENAVGKGT